MANATYLQAVQAIKQHLAAGWTTTPIVHENETPPALTDEDGHPVPFVMFEMESDGAEQRSIGSPGSNFVGDRGALIMTVFVAAGTGTDLATSYAGSIGELFRNRELEITDGACVRCWTPSVGMGQKATSENPEGSWFAVPVSIPFEFLRLA